MDLTMLNASCLAEIKPIIKLQDLELGSLYPIYKAKLVTSQFGSCICLELENKITFLPKRVTNDFEPLLSNFIDGRYAVVFRGLRNIGKPHPLIQFEIVEA